MQRWHTDRRKGANKWAFHSNENNAKQVTCAFWWKLSLRHCTDNRRISAGNEVIQQGKINTMSECATSTEKCNRLCKNNGGSHSNINHWFVDSHFEAFEFDFLAVAILDFWSQK